MKLQAVHKQEGDVSTQYRKMAEKKDKNSIPMVIGTNVGYTLLVFLLRHLSVLVLTSPSSLCTFCSFIPTSKEFFTEFLSCVGLAELLRHFHSRIANVLSVSITSPFPVVITELLPYLKVGHHFNFHLRVNHKSLPLFYL